MTETIETELQSGAATEKDLEIAFSGPALLANRFFITLGPNGVRIAFTEQGPNAEPAFRTAVGMSIQDAIGLYKVLRDLLKGPEAAIEQMQAMAEQPPKQDAR